jgi:uncharacterized Zn ribbon protein
VGDDVWNTLPEAAAEYVLMEGSNVYKSCVNALTNYFDLAKSYFFERYKFRKERQLKNETTLQYLTGLSFLIVNCNYSNNEQEILDMIVQHTLSHDIRREFLKEGDKLTLAKAKKFDRALQNSEVHSRVMEGRESDQQVFIKSQGVRGRCVVDNNALYPYGAQEPLHKLV